MTPAEFYTYQFYAWEYRGRGWFLAKEAVQLEPPFVPFFRHGGRYKQIDDGRRPTLWNRMIDSMKRTQPIYHEPDTLDYESLEPFLYESEYDLQAIQIRFPKDRRASTEKMKALLNMLSFVFSALSFEIIGTESEIIIQFVTIEEHIESLEIYLKAYFPQYTVLRNNQFLDLFTEGLSTMVVDFGLKEEFVRPIATMKGSALDPLTSLMAVLETIGSDEQAGIQILFQQTGNRWEESITRSVTMHDKSSFFKDSPEAPTLAAEKVKSPLYGVTIRAFAQAEDLKDAERILGKLNHCLINGSKSPSNELIPLLHAQYNVETRIEDILLRESHRLGMLLSQDELLTFLHFPGESVVSKKLNGSTRKTKEVPWIAQGKEYIIGINTHNGIEEPVTFAIDDRLKHTHIIGSTGTGKSTLIANLILQDIQQDQGVVLFDPHGDLVDDIIAHVPEHRLKDVVLIDPSDIEFPIGLNILEAHDDVEKEVLSSDLVSAFRRFATSWGDQMSGVLGNAILAILESTDGGSMHDLRRFLIEKDFRTKLLKTVSDPAVLYYWQKEFPFLKTNSIGPILIRLDAFLRPKSVRNMVIQKKGIDFETLLNENKIILLKLSQGLIGKENSFMLGSLILSKLHQVIQRRQRQAIRNPIFIYLDEFQNFITPSIKDMISGIRKYNAGLILVHQDLQQLQREDGELLNSVLGNANIRIVFRVGEQDAKKLQEGFSDFDYTDLQNLGKGQGIMRIEQPQYDCSLDTIALDIVNEEVREKNREAVIYHSRKNYAVSKRDIEQELYASFDAEEKGPPKRQAKPVAEDIPFEDVTAEQTEPIPMSEPVPEKKTSASQEKIEKKDIPEESVSTHRYLQNLVKQMAEANGYTAVLEMQLPANTGKVDVSLQKDGKMIAVEICVTTDVEWEVHNIQKCLQAKYPLVVSLSGDIKQLERIKKKCLETIDEFDSKDVLFFTPDALLAYLQETATVEKPGEQVMKGYRVNVTYDAQSASEAERKRSLVAKIINTSLKGKKK